MLKIKNPDFVELICKHDIIFLNECWLSSTSSVEISNYTCFLKPRKKRKRAKRDSGGLCILVRNNLIKHLEKVDWNFEDGFILKSKYPCRTNDKLLYFVFIYLKPATSSRNELVDDLDDFDKFSEKIAELKLHGEIIIIGDMNARTGQLLDIYDTSFLQNSRHSPDQFESDSLITFDDLKMNNITPKRKNKDTKTNDYGHKLTQLCKMSGLLICNGRLEGDLEGEFTYQDKKGESVIDYALVSKGLLSHLHSFCIQTPTIFSDHNSILLKLKDSNLFFSYSKNDNCFSNDTCTKTYKWCNEKSLPVFSSNMNDDVAVEKLNSIIAMLHIYENTDVIDDSIDILYNVLEQAAQPLLYKKKHNFKFSEKKDSQPWYDNECKNKKKEFDNAILFYKESGDDIDLKNLTEIRNSYRKLCRKKKQ